MRTRSTIILGTLLSLALCLLPRPAVAGCTEVLARLADKTIGATCFHADDLRTANPPTAPVTPPDDSITTFADGTALPGSTIVGSDFSYTPVTDLEKISIGPTPTTTSTAVPGIQVEGWFADDPSGEARFLLRFPTTGTASWWLPAPAARAANSTATGHGATMSCPRDTLTPRRTRAS